MGKPEFSSSDTSWIDELIQDREPWGATIKLRKADIWSIAQRRFLTDDAVTYLVAYYDSFEDEFDTANHLIDKKNGGSVLWVAPGMLSVPPDSQVAEGGQNIDALYTEFLPEFLRGNGIAGALDAAGHAYTNILLPVNRSNMHWSLIVLYKDSAAPDPTKAWSAIHYDSLSKSRANWTRAQEIVADLKKHKLLGAGVTLTECDFMPQQAAYNSCGVFLGLLANNALRRGVRTAFDRGELDGLFDAERAQAFRGTYLLHFWEEWLTDPDFADAGARKEARREQGGREEHIRAIDPTPALTGTSPRARLEYEGKEVRSERLPAVRSTREGTAMTSVNTQANLPIVDAHCHLGGMSLSGSKFSTGTPGTQHWSKKKWAFKVVTAPARLVTYPLSEAVYAATKSTIVNFVYYNSSADVILADKLMNSMTHFCDEIQMPKNAAAIAMVVDLTSVPLNPDSTNASLGAKTGSSKKTLESKMISEQAERDEKLAKERESNARKAAKAHKKAQSKYEAARRKYIRLKGDYDEACNNHQYVTERRGSPSDLRKADERRNKSGGACQKAKQELDAARQELDTAKSADYDATNSAQQSRSDATEMRSAAQAGENEPLYYTHPDDRLNSDYEYIWYPRDRATVENALDEIAKACQPHPGRIWPYAPFDPRRPGALDIVKKAIATKGFCGVKLYSRTGWMPIHNRKLYGDRLGDKLDEKLDELYAWCVSEDVPLLCHTSPTGFPPDDMIVHPWTMTDRGEAINPQTKQRWHNPTLNTPSPLGYGDIVDDGLYPVPPYREFDLLPSLKKKGQEKLDAERECAVWCFMWAARWHALYCVFMQRTTSPYAWAPVLTMRPNLRLNLAHFGADLGALMTRRRNVKENKEWRTKTMLQGPYVAGVDPDPMFNFRDIFKGGVKLKALQLATKFSNGDFTEFRMLDETLGARMKTLKGRLAWRDANKAKRIAEQIDKLLENRFDEEFFAAEEWERWFKAWERLHPLTWHEKILELLAGGYENLYTDISYLTTDPDMFPSAIKGVVDEALTDTSNGIALQNRLMIGTDWFMTEMESCSPRDFWRMAWDNVLLPKVPRPPDSDEGAKRRRLWSRWATENALRWINLDPRMAALEAFYNNRMMPVWWDELKKFYANPPARAGATGGQASSNGSPPSSQPAVSGASPSGQPVSDSPSGPDRRDQSSSAPASVGDSGQGASASQTKPRASSDPAPVVASGSKGGEKSDSSATGGGSGGGTSKGGSSESQSGNDIDDLRRRVGVLESDVSKLKGQPK